MLRKFDFEHKLERYETTCLILLIKRQRINMEEDDSLSNSEYTATWIFKCQQIQVLPEQPGPANTLISDYQCQMILALPESSCLSLCCMIIMQLF